MIEIGSGELTARVAPLGAELLSLTDAAGREYMTDADPAFWTGHAPLLFPIVGGLAGDAYRLDGCEYALPRHGFARRSEFTLVGQAGDRALFRLADSPATRETYPFAFVLEMEFALSGLTLAMTATVRNPGDVALTFSLGFHPAFAWPLPGGGDKLAHHVVFEQPEPQPVRRLDGAGLLATHEATPVEGRTLALRPELFEADALIWDSLASRALSYRSPGGARLDLAFPDTPMLGVWQKPGANFICLEPWAGIADPAGFAGDFRDKPGATELAPGASRAFRVSVAVTPA